MALVRGQVDDPAAAVFGRNLDGEIVTISRQEHKLPCAAVPVCVHHYGHGAVSRSAQDIGAEVCLWNAIQWLVPP